MMRILGVDPGLKATGYGVLEVLSPRRTQAILVETGTIEPRQSDGIETRIHTVYHHLSEIILQHHPSIMVLEKLYAHYRHPTTACLLGHVRGVICLVCAKHGLELVEHSVKRIRKALVGDGNASKQQTRKAVTDMLGIDAKKMPLDASDALALAVGYVAMQRV